MDSGHESSSTGPNTATATATAAAAAAGASSVGESLPRNRMEAPKRRNKARRERLKREHMNELFLELGRDIEPARQYNCKASILDDATKLLQDLFAEVESRRKESKALEAESHDVAVEKNELKDENAKLEAEIGELRKKLGEKVHLFPVWNNSTAAVSFKMPLTTRTVSPHQQQQQQHPSIVSPVVATPLNQEHEFCEVASNSPSYIARPKPRYPTSESWPLQLLSSLSAAAQEPNQNIISNSTTPPC